IVLNVEDGTTCSPGLQTFWSGATDTPGFTAPPCGLYNGGDVWFTFELPEESTIYITTSTAILPYDGIMALYLANSCDGTVEYVACNDDGGPGFMPRIELPSVEPGTYFVRFWSYNGNTSGNISICVAATEPLPAPANDEPCNAIDLSVELALSC